MKTITGLAVALTAAGAMLALSAPARAASCDSLKDLQIKDVRVTAAETVQPGWKYPASIHNTRNGPNAAASSFCRVAVTVEKEISVEVWLPPNWNGRFLGVGNGALGGGINYPAMAEGVAKGFATASTDTGHVTPTNGFDATWVDGHPDRVVNFAYRGHHLMAETAKKIVAAYYARPARYAYYDGCSSGGWQGLTEAQKFPDDYDGVVAGAPAIDFVKLQAMGLIGQQMSLNDPSSILASKGQLLVAAALAHCDDKDGLKDGLISNPLACDFDPATIQCKGADAPDCLTAAQVARARKSYGPQVSRGGMKLYPGMAWGAPPSIEYGGPGVQAPGDSMGVRAMAKHPDWTVATFDPDRDLPAMERELGPVLDSTDPDLTRFKRRGGKLILYHGWADPLLSPYNTVDYYDSVVAKMGGSIDDFVRLFFEPGMAHCRGGYGPDTFDALSAMVSWVEQGRAPEMMIAAHKTAGAVDRTRPLCAYPKQARYKGTGSIDDAANFACAKP